MPAKKKINPIDKTLAKIKETLPKDQGKIDKVKPAPFNREIAIKGIEQGYSCAKIARDNNFFYLSVYRCKQKLDQVKKNSAEYIATRANISRSLQELVDANINKFLVHLLSLDPETLTDKDISNNLAKLATVRQQLYAMERTEEGKATAPIAHFWNIIVNQGENKLKDSLDSTVIDVPERAIKQTIIDVDQSGAN